MRLTAIGVGAMVKQTSMVNVLDRRLAVSRLTATDLFAWGPWQRLTLNNHLSESTILNVPSASRCETQIYLL